MVSKLNFLVEASMLSDNISKIHKQNNPPRKCAELRDPPLTYIPEMHSQENNYEKATFKNPSSKLNTLISYSFWGLYSRTQTCNTVVNIFIWMNCWNSIHDKRLMKCKTHEVNHMR